MIPEAYALRAVARGTMLAQLRASLALGGAAAGALGALLGPGATLGACYLAPLRLGRPTTVPGAQMARLWRCTLQVHSGAGVTALYGYGATQEAAYREAHELSQYCEELKVPGTKPKLDQVDESVVTGVPMIRR